MRANLSLKSTWDPLVIILEKRLNSWKHRHVSLGDRVALLNLVFNTIYIFFLSFLKMLIMVWKKIVSLQRRFLEGVKNMFKIPYANWDDVSKPKSIWGN